MMISWAHARETILEETELGYSLKSLDRLWMVFAFVVPETDGVPSEKLYPMPPDSREGRWSTDLVDDEIVFTTRRAADNYVRLLRADPQWSRLNIFVINVGDDRRLEALTFGGAESRRVRPTPKFAGSSEAWGFLNTYRLMYGHSERGN